MDRSRRDPGADAQVPGVRRGVRGARDRRRIVDPGRELRAGGDRSAVRGDAGVRCRAVRGPVVHGERGCTMKAIDLIRWAMQLTEQGTAAIVADLRDAPLTQPTPGAKGGDG